MVADSFFKANADFIVAASAEKPQELGNTGVDSDVLITYSSSFIDLRRNYHDEE